MTEVIHGKLSFRTVTFVHIGEVLLSLSSNSVAADGLSLRMLRLCCPFFLAVICNIINTCLLEGVFPSA